MNEFDKSIIEAGKSLRRGYAAIEANISKIIAAITAALAVLLTFAEIAPPSLATASLGLDLAVMLISSYVIYFSLEDSGERLGRETDEYKEIREKYLSQRNRIKPSMIEALRGFLTDYKKEEQEYRISSAMTFEGITKEELKAFMAGQKFERRKARALRRIANIKPIELDVNSLLGDGGREQGGAISDPRRGKLIRLILKLIPSTVCILFTVSMMITAKGGIDIGAIISGIVKLSTLPIIGLKGYSAGYTYSTESEAIWIRAKSRLLEAFLDKVTHESQGAEL